MVSLITFHFHFQYSVYNQRSLRNEFTVMELFEPKQTTDNLVPSPWEIMISSLLPSTSSAFLDKRDNHNHFSSLSRAAHSAHGGKNEGVLIPDLLQRVFILASPLRSGALAVSLTERGITAKSLLCEFIRLFHLSRLYQHLSIRASFCSWFGGW